MLKLLKQYYPIRTSSSSWGEHFHCPVDLARHMGDFRFSFALPARPTCPSGAVGLVLQTCLYYNDLYEFKVSKTFKELGLRLLERWAQLPSSWR